MLLHSDRPIRREMTSFAANGIAKTLGNVWGRFDIRVALWLNDCFMLIIQTEFRFVSCQNFVRQRASTVRDRQL